MPRFVSLVKYTPEALAAVREAGYASRVAAITGVAESLGGTVESIDFLISGEWDFMVRMDLPTSDAAFAMASMSTATGVIERVVTHELFTADQADGAVAASSIVYTPPGQ